MPLLEAKDLTKSYRHPHDRAKRVTAVAGASFAVEAAQTLGVVGESGCGKSTLARLMLLLERPDSGSLLYEGKPTSGFKRADLKQFRRNVQIVFQDPMASLNPRMKIRQVLEEPFQIHGQKFDVRTAAGLLEDVGLQPALAGRYPHELSGGERQRVCIARAIALHPKLVICDEAVSSLDVLVQAGILNLLLKLQRQKSLALVFISHDLGVVRHMSDRLIVMQAGKIVEAGSADQIYRAPKEAYTQELLSSANLEFA